MSFLLNDSMPCTHPHVAITVPLLSDPHATGPLWSPVARLCLPLPQEEPGGATRLLSLQLVTGWS